MDVYDGFRLDWKGFGVLQHIDYYVGFVIRLLDHYTLDGCVEYSHGRLIPLLEWPGIRVERQQLGCFDDGSGSGWSQAFRSEFEKVQGYRRHCPTMGISLVAAHLHHAIVSTGNMQLWIKHLTQ